MPLNLTTPTAISDTVSSVKINSFAVDLDRKEIHVAYSELNASNAVVSEKGITIVEPDFTQAIVDASTTAGTDVYGPLKESLYNQIQLATLQSGVVA